MKIAELLEYFEGYYGEKYTGVFLHVMNEYLEGYSESYLDAIANVVVRKFPRHFNKSPDPAIIEENRLLIKIEWENINQNRDINDKEIKKEKSNDSEKN